MHSRQRSRQRGSQASSQRPESYNSLLSLRSIRLKSDHIDWAMRETVFNAAEAHPSDDFDRVLVSSSDAFIELMPWNDHMIMRDATEPAFVQNIDRIQALVANVLAQFTHEVVHGIAGVVSDHPVLKQMAQDVAHARQVRDAVPQVFAHHTEHAPACARYACNVWLAYFLLSDSPGVLAPCLWGALEVHKPRDYNWDEEAKRAHIAHKKQYPHKPLIHFKPYKTFRRRQLRAAANKSQSGGASGWHRSMSLVGLAATCSVCASLF